MEKLTYLLNIPSYDGGYVAENGGLSNLEEAKHFETEDEAERYVEIVKSEYEELVAEYGVDVIMYSKLPSYIRSFAETDTDSLLEKLSEQRMRTSAVPKSWFSKRGL